jgi:hypothetical protein
MRPSRLTGFAGLILASGCLVSTAFGQWTAGLEIGANRYWGGSAYTGGDSRSFHPYRPTAFGFGIEHKRKQFAYGLQVRYAEAALALEGPAGTAAVGGVFTVVSISPEIVYRLATLGPVTEVRLHAGPLLEIWGTIDEKTKGHLGAQSAVSFDLPLGGRFSGSVLGGLALTPSVFEEGQLGVDFEPRALWQRRFAVGLHYRL